MLAAILDNTDPTLSRGRRYQISLETDLFRRPNVVLAWRTFGERSAGEKKIVHEFVLDAVEHALRIRKQKIRSGYKPTEDDFTPLGIKNFLSDIYENSPEDYSCKFLNEIVDLGLEGIENWRSKGANMSFISSCQLRVNFDASANNVIQLVPTAQKVYLDRDVYSMFCQYQRLHPLIHRLIAQNLCYVGEIAQMSARDFQLATGATDFQLKLVKEKLNRAGLDFLCINPRWRRPVQRRSLP